MEQPEENTDTELFRENEADYYSPSLHKTEHAKIGIDVGGTVYVKSLREWHKLAEQRQETRQHETIVIGLPPLKEMEGEILEALENLDIIIHADEPMIGNRFATASAIYKIFKNNIGQ